MDVEVPLNTNANVFLPTLNATNILEDNHVIKTTDYLVVKGFADGYLYIKLESGKYHFTISN